MNNFENKIDTFLFDEIKDKKNLTILEFGVRQGISTKKFIKLCETNGGHLYSVDTDDCSTISNSSKWTFFKTRDDNFDFLEKKLPKKFDIIFLDSFHDANHVKKIIYYYYEKLKRDGIFYIDDISWLPYLKNNFRDNFNCEINNQETFEKLLEITKVNHENFDIHFSFVLSGAEKKKKKNDNKLIMSNRIISRKLSLKNIIRSIYRKFT